VAKAVLFDLDGTLVDSDSLWRDAFTSLIVERHGRVPAGTTDGLVGLATADAVATIGGRLGWPVADAVPNARWVEQRVRDRYRGGGVPWCDGALELVAAARAWGAKVGLVTSSTGEAVGAIRADRECPAFDVVVTGDDVTAAKPAPEPYLAAAKSLRLRAGECVVVEDSTVGVTSAWAAGCAVIAVGEHATAPDLPRILRVGSLTDVMREDVNLLTKQVIAGGYLLG
jgi:HAD superfamily hydrolase (TIGR01509 family)